VRAITTATSAARRGARMLRPALYDALGFEDHSRFLAAVVQSAAPIDQRRSRPAARAPASRPQASTRRAGAGHGAPPREFRIGQHSGGCRW
jgi:hypothetical protein